jgi:hypothetical protein
MGHISEAQSPETWGQSTLSPLTPVLQLGVQVTLSPVLQLGVQVTLSPSPSPGGRGEQLARYSPLSLRERGRGEGKNARANPSFHP